MMMKQKNVLGPLSKLATVVLSFAILTSLSGCGGGGSSSDGGGTPTPTPATDVTVDFGSRSGGATIPAGLFGSQLANLTNTTAFSDPVSAMKTLAGAGMSTARVLANVPSVFATPTPDWTKIDGTLDQLKTSGMSAIFVIAYTPTWLQPTATPGPCQDPYPSTHNAQPYNAAPANNDQYASIAAQYVGHINSKYPGLVSYYEVWNEADESNTFCGLNAGDSTNDQQRLNEYLALYKSAAIAMKAQAAADGVTIKVGGPALGDPVNSVYWVQQLVQQTNSGAQIVDFVSYHQYLAGNDISSTMTWDGGTDNLLSRTLASGKGIAAVYQNINTAAVGGAFKVPVLLDEFNDDWDFTNTCCKNSPQYSPVWNTMVFSLIMNTVYSGSQPIQGLTYYAASNKPFCLLGVVDSTYSCSPGSGAAPYPQFRAYELLASSNYLGLQAGGNLANAVTLSTAMNTAKLVASAFYTKNGNAIVLVNPTASAINNASLVVKNLGFTTSTATQYTLNASTYSPTSGPSGTAFTLTAGSTGSTGTFTVPAYSVVAIKITGQ